MEQQQQKVAVYSIPGISLLAIEASKVDTPFEYLGDLSLVDYIFMVR